MTYKNLKTGAVVVTDCTVSGADWRAVPPPPEPEAPAKPRRRKPGNG